MKSVLFGIFIFCAAGSFAPAYAGESLLSEQDIPSLQEQDFGERIKREDCIIMFYNSGLPDDDEASKKAYGAPAQRLGDDWMKTLLSFQRQAGLYLKLYKADWKSFSAESIERIRTDAGSLYRKPESPSYVAYINGGETKFAVRGPARPDMTAWFANEMLAHSIAVINMEKGEFMRGPGWFVTDTNAKFVRLTGMRRESIVFNGRSENVQIVTYESIPYNGTSCTYEAFFAGQGKLIGMNEACGKNPQTGYFDFDRTGKMQYRVRPATPGRQLHP